MLSRSLNAGYNAVGFYLEHRFAYPSAPWATGPGALTPEQVSRLCAEFHPRGLRIIPFLNTLGHMEGFIRAEGGQHLAEGAGEWSLQICPSKSECQELARSLVKDASEVFRDEWIHLGGDETHQLGECPLCRKKADHIGKAGLYGEYFGDLCRWVLQLNRRPCLWGDMLLAHPEALAYLPKETVIFDWHYDKGAKESAEFFRKAGFDVVCCPSIHSYDAGWCHWELTKQNIDQHFADAQQTGALGVLVTTWELSYFTNYPSILPLIYSAGRRLARQEDWKQALITEGGEGYALAVEILGNQIPQASSFLKPGTWRPLRDRLVMRLNPFELWKEWRGEACGDVGERILRLCDQADSCLDVHHPLRFSIELHRVAVLWVRAVEEAWLAYKRRDAIHACEALARGAEHLHRLGEGLIQAWEKGGSRADPLRLVRLLQYVAEVARRIAEGARHGEGFRPAFETLIDPMYVPYDQAGWRTQFQPPQS
jgi:hypothetical protein